MATTYTKFTKPVDNEFTGYIYVPSGGQSSYTGVTFFWNDGSYLDELAANANNTNILFLFTNNSAQPDLVLFNLSNLTTEYGEGNTAYFNTSGVNVPFTKTVWEDGLYYFSLTTVDGSENQWILHIPSIESSMKTLATSLINSQCDCKLDPTLSEKFVKAKAYQELIYNKVINLSDDPATVAEIQTALEEINSDISTLIAFLGDTESLCGC